MNNRYAAFFAIAKQIGISDVEDWRKEQVAIHTNMRTTSLREMSSSEYGAMIKNIRQAAGKVAAQAKKEPPPGDIMRKKIFSICYELGYVAFDARKLGRPLNAEEHKANQQVIYKLVERVGYMFKPLMSYTRDELVGLVSQFTKMRSNNQRAAANKAVKALLKELNFNTL
jgi:predicted xylose isomerase-like sugar epimerase